MPQPHGVIPAVPARILLASRHTTQDCILPLPVVVDSIAGSASGFEQAVPIDSASGERRSGILAQLFHRSVYKATPNDSMSSVYLHTAAAVPLAPRSSLRSPVSDIPEAAGRSSALRLLPPLPLSLAARRRRGLRAEIVRGAGLCILIDARVTNARGKQIKASGHARKEIRRWYYRSRK